MIDPQASVASLVLDHSECAAVLHHHRINYCCGGEATLAAACHDRGLDVGVIVGELERAIRERRGGEADARALATPRLIEHIVSRYHEPLRKMLPYVHMLAAKVARVHGDRNPRLGHLEELVAELAETLEQHIDEEEATLFPSLVKGEPDRNAARLLKTTREEHEAVGELLTWIRSATEDYAVPAWACSSYRTLFRELERIETDVLRHVHLENHVLLPRFARDARCA